MYRKLQGQYVISSTIGERVKAFIPDPLPPNPPIDWDNNLHYKFNNASLALGRLDAISTLLPDTSLFIYMYVRKEAVLSSEIEGTQSSLSDLMLYELNEKPSVPLDDVQEVSNYVAALTHGLELLNNGLPISLRLIREIYSVLLAKGRGCKQTPGEFRRSQNLIGGTHPDNAVFIPPLAEEVMNCMGKLELFLHDEPEKTDPLLKASLAHVQFETIHPFLDGNGRLGRLLITLILCEQKVLREPILYLSLYFKEHRQIYYNLLDNVRRTGDWEAWLAFFADAVATTAGQAFETVQELLKLAKQDRQTITNLGRNAPSTLLVFRALLERPLTTAGYLEKKTNLSLATVNKSLEQLQNIGIINELSKKKRNRIFSYDKYIAIMSRGADTTT